MIRHQEKINRLAKKIGARRYERRRRPFPVPPLSACPSPPPIYSIQLRLSLTERRWMGEEKVVT